MNHIDSLFPLISLVMGRRGRSIRRASGYFGHSKPGSFWNPSLLLTALGLGVGAYEVYRSSTKASHAGASPLAPGDTTVLAGSPPGGAPPAGGSPTGGPPPLPQSTAPGALAPGIAWTDGRQRLLQLMLAAARADGDLGEEEYGRLLAEGRRIGAEELIEAERLNPRPLPAIVSGVGDPALAGELYTLAYGIVRADEQVTNTERIWLARLASLLGLDAQTTNRLERETDQHIDRRPEESR